MRVIATFWYDGGPVYILENGDVMKPDGHKHDSLTAKAKRGYNGSYGYNVYVYRDNEKIADFSVGE